MRINKAFKIAFLLMQSLFLISCGGGSSTSPDPTNINADKESSQPPYENIQYGSRFAGIDVGVQPINSTQIIDNAYYIDPINGTPSGDGSKENPWQSLTDVIKSGMIESQAWNALPYKAEISYLIPRNQGAPIRGGDTLYLMSGNYGNLFLQGYYNTAPITLKAYPGQKPVFNAISLQAGSNWTFDGITILKPEENATTGPLFSAKKHSWQGPISNITIQNSYISSAQNVDGWTTDQWNSAKEAINSDASNFIARNNTLKNVGYGIISYGDHSLIEHNTIDHFSYDGMRGLGNYSTYQYNLIKNSIQTGSGNHDDAFQSWKINGPVIGSVLHANTIIDYEDPNQPYSSVSPTGHGLQGIGLFDGPFIDWVITDNVILINHYHGISLYDSVGATIVNNTVVDRNYGDAETPWILLSTKNRLPLNEIKDNVVMDNVITGAAFTSNGVSMTANTFAQNLTGSVVTPDIFVNYAGFNLTLKNERLVIKNP